MTEFPKLKAIRGLGMTDKEGYASILAEKFDYTNTFYDREPSFDFTEAHEQLAGTYDFILSADVLEHIAPPVERALTEVCVLLKPQGFFVVTVYCNPNDRMREHFPDLHEFRVVPLGESALLVNRAQDGTVTVRDELIFHGGSGATLEMREFGITELRAKLLASGFREVHFLNDNVPEIGIFFDHDVSQPLLARKEAFVLNRCAEAQLIDLWRAAEDQASRERDRADLLAREIRLASQSKWIELGNKLGLGPKLR
ncbi:MAG: methyltransferase domain-containing protein [Bryobacteraceae bacterium]